MRIATRGSALARWQAEHVAGLLRATDPGLEVELVLVQTEGDRRRNQPIHELGGQGVFVKEVEQALYDGRADLAVHSAKDLPSTTADGLVLAAVTERADPRDALVGSTLADLAPGATVATGSVRRRAQLARARPDLSFVDLRGNIGTRLAKIPPGGAIVVAAAALHRLGLTDRMTEALAVDVMVPQVGQGALGVECRADDAETGRRLRRIEHEPSRLAVDVERAFLARLGGGCDLPVGGYATVDAVGNRVELRTFLAGEDATFWIDRREGPLASAPEWASDVADAALSAVAGS